MRVPGEWPRSRIVLLVRWHYSRSPELNEEEGKRRSSKRGLTGTVKCCLEPGGSGSSPGASLQVGPGLWPTW